MFRMKKKGVVPTPQRTTDYSTHLPLPPCPVTRPYTRRRNIHTATQTQTTVMAQILSRLTEAASKVMSRRNTPCTRVVKWRMGFFTGSVVLLYVAIFIFSLPASAACLPSGVCAATSASMTCT